MCSITDQDTDECAVPPALRLDPASRHICHAISTHMWANGSSFRASQSTLARETGLSLRTVKSKLPEIVARQWLVITAAATGTRPATYAATIPSGATVAPRATSKSVPSGATDAVAVQLAAASGAPVAHESSESSNESTRLPSDTVDRARRGIASARERMRQAS